MSEQSFDNKIEQLLQEQKVLLENVMQQNKKIQRRLTMIVVAGYIKFFLVLAPIIVALLFLPPLFKQVTSQYSSLFNMSSGEGGGSLDTQEIQKAVSGLSSKDIQDILSLIGR